jgi:hypothetical protein
MQHDDSRAGLVTIGWPVDVKDEVRVACRTVGDIQFCRDGKLGEGVIWSRKRQQWSGRRG